MVPATVVLMFAAAACGAEATEPKVTSDKDAAASPDQSEEGGTFGRPRPDQPEEAARRARAWASAHGTVSDVLGCEKHPYRDIREAKEQVAAESGGPVSGKKEDDDRQYWVCDLTGRWVERGPPGTESEEEPEEQVWTKARVWLPAERAQPDAPELAKKQGPHVGWGPITEVEF